MQGSILSPDRVKVDEEVSLKRIDYTYDPERIGDYNNKEENENQRDKKEGRQADERYEGNEIDEEQEDRQVCKRNEVKNTDEEQECTQVDEGTKDKNTAEENEENMAEEVTEHNERNEVHTMDESDEASQMDEENKMNVENEDSMIGNEGNEIDEEQEDRQVCKRNEVKNTDEEQECTQVDEGTKDKNTAEENEENMAEEVTEHNERNEVHTMDESDEASQMDEENNMNVENEDSMIGHEGNEIDEEQEDRQVCKRNEVKNTDEEQECTQVDEGTKDKNTAEENEENMAEEVTEHNERNEVNTLDDSNGASEINEENNMNMANEDNITDERKSIRGGNDNVIVEDSDEYSDVDGEQLEDISDAGCEDLENSNIMPDKYNGDMIEGGSKYVCKIKYGTAEPVYKNVTDDEYVVPSVSNVTDEIANYSECDDTDDEEQERNVDSDRQSEDTCSIKVQSITGEKDKGKDYTKTHDCYFCETPQLKLARHIVKRHRNEPEIAALPDIPENIAQNKTKRQRVLKERKVVLAKYRNLGDFNHNVKVLQNKDGTLIVGRRHHTEKSPSYRDYLPCNYCLTFFVKQELWRHCQHCTFRKTPLNKYPDKKQAKDCIVASTMLLNGATGVLDMDQVKFNEHVLNNMHSDEISRTIKSDRLLIHFGKAQYAKLGSMRAGQVREKLRLLGRTKLKLRSLTSKPCAEFGEFLSPQFFDDCIKGVKALAEVSNQESLSGTVMYKRPSVILKVGQLLKRVAGIKRGFAIRKDDTSAKQEASDFLELHASEWQDTVSGVAHQNLSERRYNKKEILPLTSDLIKLTVSSNCILNVVKL